MAGATALGRTRNRAAAGGPDRLDAREVDRPRPERPGELRDFGEVPEVRPGHHDGHADRRARGDRGPDPAHRIVEAPRDRGVELVHRRGRPGERHIEHEEPRAGRDGTDHLFLVTDKETRYVDCRDAPLPYYERLIADVVERTETAMSQAHCFKVCELALAAQTKAARLT